MAHRFDLVGKQLGNYQILELIGEGGMGNVYKARHVDFTMAAVKILPRASREDDAFTRRFHREARAIQELGDHPNIISLLDYGVAESISYVAMPLLVGGTLSDRLRDSLLDIDITANMLDKIANALHYAHERGIIHRDVKPDNIMFDEYGELYLVDFGIAKIFANDASTITRTGTRVGTPRFMAPEQWTSGIISGATDQYSLATVVYMMLTGDIPYPGGSQHELMFQHISGTPKPLHEARPDLPRATSNVLMRALEKNPRDRYSTIIEFAEAFRASITAAQDQSPVLSVNPKALQNLTNTLTTPRGLGALLAVVALLVAIPFGVFFFSNNGGDNSADSNAAVLPTTATKDASTSTPPPTQATTIAVTATSFAENTVATDVQPTTATTAIAVDQVVLASPTQTSMLMPTASVTAIPTQTHTPTDTHTPTAMQASTVVPTSTSTASATPTATPTETASHTATFTATGTATAPPSATATPTHTPTNTLPPTPAFTASASPTPTLTFTPSATPGPLQFPLAVANDTEPLGTPCQMSPAGSAVNLREEPSTSARVLTTASRTDVLTGIVRTVGDMGFVWYFTNSGGWIRNDVATINAEAQDACDALPIVTGAMALEPSKTVELSVNTNQRAVLYFSGNSNNWVRLRVVGTRPFDPVLVLRGPDGTELTVDDSVPSFGIELDALLTSDGLYTATIYGYLGRGGGFSASLEQLN